MQTEMQTEMQMPRYPTVLFDLDGTLIDSIGLILDSFRHTFAAFGLPPRPDEEWLQGVGIPLATQLAAWVSDPATVEAMVATYREYNLKHHDARVRVYPGIANAVSALRAEGIRLGLVTSKLRQTARRGLQVAGIEGALEVLVGVDDVTFAKPHREPVDRAVAALGAAPESTIFVGDSVHDMWSGRSAGVATGAALWGPSSRADLAPAEPTHWFDSPDDLVKVVLS